MKENKSSNDLIIFKPKTGFNHMYNPILFPILTSLPNKYSKVTEGIVD